MRAAERAELALDAKETARLFAAFNGHAKLALAVSGGPDSMALMRLAARWRADKADAPELCVFTVDHGLRPQSGEEARQVGEWARQLGLPCTVLIWQRDDAGGNLQAAARGARYRLMAQACHRQGADAVVTAHHLDDQAETFLLRLGRGSGVDGLGAMSETTRIFGITVLRPLLDVPHARLLATLDAFGQPFISDPSNDSDAFARVRLRALMARLAEEGMTPQRLAATAKRMRRARAALDAATDELARTAATLDPLGFCTLQETLASASDEIALRLLSRIVMAVAASATSPAEAALERMLDMISNATSGGMTLAGCRMELKRGGAVFFREKGRSGLPGQRLDQEHVTVWDGRFRVRTLARFRPLDLRPLGTEGIAAMRHAGSKPRMASRIAATCPSFWKGNELVFAPQIIDDKRDFGAPGLAMVDFLGTLGAGAGRAGPALHGSKTMF